MVTRSLFYMKLLINTVLLVFLYFCIFFETTQRSVSSDHYQDTDPVCSVYSLSVINVTTNCFNNQNPSLINTQVTFIVISVS